MNSRLPALAVVVAALGFSLPAAPAGAADYNVKVTCTVPTSQPERQIAPNHCRNYLPDGTQTYIAKVTGADGRPISGVKVYWSDNSDAARFRARQNPCTTGSNGACKSELVVRNPKRSMFITVTATAGGASAVGYLSFF